MNLTSGTIYVSASAREPTAAAAATKKGKTADDEDAASSDIPDADDNNNNDDLEPMKACHDPFPTAAVLRVSGLEPGDELPEEYREGEP